MANTTTKKTSGTKAKIKETVEEVKTVETPQIDMEALIAQITKSVTAEVEKKYEEKLKEQLVQVEKSKTIEKVKEEIVEEIKKPSRMFGSVSSKVTGFDLNGERKVPVISIKNTPVGYNCKLKKMEIVWSKFGEEHMLPIEELNMMNSESSKFLQTPWLIVDDEEYIEAMGLSELYESVLELQDLVSFYKNNRTVIIKDKLDALDSSFRKDVLKRTIAMLQNGELNDMSVVRMLKNDYKIDIEI